MDNQDVAKIAELARAGVLHAVKPDDGREFVLVPEGYKLTDISDPKQVYAPPPDRVRQKLTLSTLDGFVDYMRAFDGAGTRMFADVNANRVVGVLDYHGPSMLPQTAGVSSEAMQIPTHTEHRATLQLQLSEEWKRWSEISGKLMQQADFARWLEENLVDIEDPAGADVLEIVRDMSAAKKVNFKSAIRLDNGDREFEWTTETTAASKTGSLTVPSMFVLRIPIFYGSEAVEVRAFLRWRLDEGAIAFGIELYRPAYVKQAVFEKIGREICERVARPLHFGVLD